MLSKKADVMEGAAYEGQILGEQNERKPYVCLSLTEADTGTDLRLSVVTVSDT